MSNQMNNGLTERNAREEIAANSDPESLKKNMFVEAGAGAGKTYLIVQRIVNLLKQGVTPSQIVVITFTNAAAEELRGRITGQVQKASLNDETLKSAFSTLDEMNISTIHSFCNVLLKEQATTAKLPLDLTVIEDKDEQRLLKKLFNAYLRETFDSKEWDRLEKMCPKTDAQGHDLKQSPREIIRDRMYKMFQGIFAQPDGVEIKHKNSQELNKELEFLESLELDNPNGEICARVSRIKNKVLESANSLIIADEKKLSSFDKLPEDEKLIGKTFRETDFIFKQEDVLQEDKYFLKWALSGVKIFNKPNTKAYNKDGIEDAHRAIKALVDKEYKDIKALAGDEKDVKSLARSITNDVLNCELLMHADKAVKFCKERFPSNMVTNDMLLELAGKLICDEENDSALRYFSSKYKCFFVDEFQDTDSIQADFIYRLASDLTDTEHIRLRDGALFVVGDPKQSIYRFRGAQPEVYFDIKDRMKKLDNAVVYELKWNFRSNNELIDWINNKFEEADGMRGNTDPENIMYIVDKGHPYIPMEPQKKVAKGDDKLLKGPYRYTVADSFTIRAEPDAASGEGSTKEWFVPSGYNSQKDVQDVVDLIKNLIDGGYKITDYDENTHEPFSRKIIPSDILLMTHKKGNMKQYLTELKKCGISVRLDGEASLTEDIYVNIFLRIYRHLINPKDRFGRVAALEAIRMTDLIKDEEKLDVYSDYLLDSLRKGTRGMTPYGVAEYLERQLSALLHKDKDISFIDVNTSMARIRQMIEYVCQNEHGNGISIIKSMESFIQDKLEHELTLERNADSSIRLMNLHKTKGLEGKIVIIADRNNKIWEQKLSSYRRGNEYYPGYRILKAYWNPWEKDKDLLASYVAEEKAEFHRLEYVAVTRAEQVVIFMNTVAPGCIFANRVVEETKNYKHEIVDTSLKDGFDYKLRELPSIEGIINEKKNAPREPKASDKYDVRKDNYTYLLEKDNDADERKHAIYEKQSPSLLEVKENERTFRKEVLERAKKQGITRKSQKSKALKRPSDNHVGNVLHRTMELLLERYDGEAGDEEAQNIALAATRQALFEHMDEIERGGAKKEDAQGEEDMAIWTKEEYTLKEVEDFIGECAKSYYRWLKEQEGGLLKGRSHIYPELPFSYYSDDEEKKIFMKGNADLIITKEDGSAILIDYKSDHDYCVPEEDIQGVFKEKYGPQLSVYKKIINRLLNIPEDKISSYIISFSQKDCEGTVYEDTSIRVRCTEIVTC